MVQSIELKGLHRVNMKLKDGSVVAYYYAWRSGPRMVTSDGVVPDFGTPEFLTLFHKLTAPPATMPVFSDIVAKYKASQDFDRLAKSTKATYARAIDNGIEPKFGELPIEFLAVPAVRGKFKDWRDEFAAAGMKAKADQYWSVLQKLCAFAVDRGIISTNPCLNPGRLYKSDRSEIIWSEEDLATFYASASPHISAVVIYALWTGQRLSDCLSAKWSDLIVGGKIKVRQDKRGAKIAIPIGAALGELLARLPHTEAGTILTNSFGKKWTTDGFKTVYGRAFATAGIFSGVHFHDLRGTAVTRMSWAGCTPQQIAAITGHSLKTVHDMLENNYLGGRAILAEQAAALLEKWAVNGS